MDVQFNLGPEQTTRGVLAGLRLAGLHREDAYGVFHCGATYQIAVTKHARERVEKLLKEHGWTWACDTAGDAAIEIPDVLYFRRKTRKGAKP